AGVRTGPARRAVTARREGRTPLPARTATPSGSVAVRGGGSGHAWRRGGVGGPVRLAGPGLLRRPVPSAPGRGRAWRRGPFFWPLRGRRPRGGRGPVARTGPSFVGPNGRPWRGGCSVRGPLARTAGSVRAATVDAGQHQVEVEANSDASGGPSLPRAADSGRVGPGGWLGCGGGRGLP